MKRKGILFALLLTLVFVFAIPVKTEASWKFRNGNYYYFNAQGVLLKNRRIGSYYVGADGARAFNTWKGKHFYAVNGKRIKNFKGGWYVIEGKKYYYSSKGKMATKWKTIKGNRYYFGKDGAVAAGWQKIGSDTYYFSKKAKTYGRLLKGWQAVEKKRFYFEPVKGKLQTGWFTVETKKYFADELQGIMTGIVTIETQDYIFNAEGALLNGWQNYEGNRYYLTSATGAMAKGLCGISGKTYYFNEYGVLQISTTIIVDGQTYTANEKGVCTLLVPGDGVSENMLFFTWFESGAETYGQAGGDNGNACGRYQFDYRYSLLPIVKYCYSNDPVTFKAFKKWAACTSGSQLKKTDFYNTWRKIYKDSPAVFKYYQDKFALENYYNPVANSLRISGIDMDYRPDVVKGAVYSYSIQHGSGTAAAAVKAAKIKMTTSNEDFIKKLYKYRIKQYPAYKSRYTQEMNRALDLL